MTRDLLARHDTSRWPFIAMILVAALAGSIAVPVQILLAKSGQSASHAQVVHNEQIIKEAAKITHNREAELCVQINVLLVRDRLTPAVCPSPE